MMEHCATSKVKMEKLLKSAQKQKIIQNGIYNTLLSAPTRSGKGVSSVIPTLLSYPGSVGDDAFSGANPIADILTTPASGGRTSRGRGR